MNLDANANDDSLDQRLELRFRRFALAFQRSLGRQSQNRFFNESFDAHDTRRRVIFDLMRPLADRLDFAPATLFAAVGLFDAMLSQFVFSERRMENIGIVCLGVSSKVLELSPLSYSDMSFLLYSPVELRKLERLLVQNLRFRVNVVTPYQLVMQVLEFLSGQLDPAFFDRLKQVLFSICLVVCSSYEVNRYTPVGLALTVFRIVENLIKFDLGILPRIFQLAGLNEGDLSPTYQLLTRVIRDFHSLHEHTRQVKSDWDPEPTRVDTASFLSFHR